MSVTATTATVPEGRKRQAWSENVSDSESDISDNESDVSEDEFVPVKGNAESSCTTRQPMNGSNTIKTNKFVVSVEDHENGDITVLVANIRGDKPNNYEWNIIYQNLSVKLFNIESRQSNKIGGGRFGYSGFTVTICFQSGNTRKNICDFYVIMWFCRHCMFCTHHYDEAHSCNFHGSNHETSKPSKDGIPNQVYLFGTLTKNKKTGVWNKKYVHPGFKTNECGCLIHNTRGDDQIALGVPVLFTDVRDLTGSGFGHELVNRFASKNLNLEPKKKPTRKNEYVTKDHTQEFPLLPPSTANAAVTENITNDIMISDDEASHDEVSKVSDPSVVESAMTHDEEIEDLEKRIKIASLKKQLRELEADNQGMYPPSPNGFIGYPQPCYPYAPYHA